MLNPCANLIRCLKRRFTTVYLLWILIPVTGIGQAPDFKFKRITTEQGLSHSDVDAIFQDSRGFIWLGTRYGLNRYDGVKMTVYRNDPQDSTSISNNTILSIFEDHRHQLWVGTRHGLNCFNPNNNRFTRYINVAANNKSIRGNTVTGVFEDKQNHLWVSTGPGGLSSFNFESGTFTHYIHQKNNPASISSDTVNCVYQDKKGTLWVGTQNGLNQYDAAAKTFKVFNTPANKFNIPGVNNFTIIADDGSGNLWLGTKDNGAALFNTTTKTFATFNHNDLQPASLGSDVVRAITHDKSGRTWIGCVNGGLNLYNPKTNSFFHYQNDPEKLSSLSQTTITALFQDDQGNLWVGTHRGGVNLYAPHANLFNLYQEKSDPNTISYSDVKTFCQDHNGNIWIGTDGGGINLFNRDKNTFKRYTYDPKNPLSISSNAVMDIYEDHSHHIWINTFGGGLNLFDPKSGQFTHFKHDKRDPYSISSNFGQKSFEDSQGNLWIGTYYAGLNLLDIKTRKFKRIVKDPDGVTSLSGNNIVSINEDNAGNVWFGTDDGGLNAYNLKTKRFTHYFNTEATPPDIRVIFNDTHGRLWVGQLGLYLFDAKSNKFNLCKPGDELATEFIKGITQDKFGKLWISTNKGITRYNTVNQTVKKYNVHDGLQGLEYEPNAYMQTRDGEMFFGGTQGLNTFYPEKIKNNLFIPPVYITSFEIFNKTVRPGDNGSPLTNDISATQYIKLSYNQTSIALNFAALNYVTSENNQYAYKLEGFDKDWVYADNSHRASYTNLDPGIYTFRVKASNNDGIWNQKGAWVKIEITPPFWLTWWFIGLMILLIISSAYAYYRSRVNEIKKQRALLETQVKERTAEVVLKAEELQNANAELHQQSIALSKQAAELTLLNEEIQRQKEQELEKAIAQGKFEIASEVLHDIGNALVGFGAHLNRINRSLEKNNVDTIKNLAVFLKGQQEVIAGALGADKANALVTITEGLSKTQSDNQAEINTSINELFHIITHIQEILNIQRQFVRGHGGKNERKPVNLVNIIDDCRSMLSASLDKNKIELKIVAAAGNYVIKGDHTKLMQVILNILKNSIEAMDLNKPDNQITLKLTKMDDEVIELLLTDNGSGFDQATRDRMFERGFTTKKTGTGLGLYNCRSIVESHNGSFDINSDGPGKGAVTTIKFAL